MRKALLALTLSALTALPALAADSPLAGTWKLDPARSHFGGDTFTFSRLPSGVMHYSDGSATSFDFAPDGKDYPAPFGYAVNVVGHDANSWDMINKKDGKVLGTDHYTLSADGKTLTIKSDGTKPDGTPFNNEAVYTRVSGTKGPEGKWKSTKINISAPGSAVLSFPSPDTLKWDIPDYKETFEGKPDGSDHPVGGPTLPKDATLAVKKLSDHKLTYIFKAEGKPLGYGQFTVAPDGKTATDVSWAPGKESEKQTGFYVKQ